MPYYQFKVSSEPRTCKECGAEFTPRAKNQTYCSKQCKATHDNRMKREQKQDRN